MDVNDKAEKYLNEKQVSELTGLALQTLRNARFNSRLFPYVKIGRSVRYRISDIVAVMERHRIEID